MAASPSFRAILLFAVLIFTFYFIFTYFNGSSSASELIDITMSSEQNENEDEMLNEFKKTLEDSIKKSETRLSEFLPVIMDQNSDKLPERNNSLTATELCSQKNACIPKFINLTSHIRAAPSHKMLTCIVQKSLSTVMLGLFCFLFDEKRYRESGRSFSSEWGKCRFCDNIDGKAFNTLANAREKLGISKMNENEWAVMMITRDPVERFISGFVDRCIREPNGDRPCNGCGYNMTCFAEREFQRMQEKSVADVVHGTFEDVHFLPQNSHCELKVDFDSYTFIKSSEPSFVDEVAKIMERQKVSRESIEFARSQLSTKETVHVTSKYPARVFLENRLRNSPYLMELVVRMFYHDFVLFKYDFPPGF